MNRVAMSVMVLAVGTAQLGWAGTCYIDDPSNFHPYQSPIQEGTNGELASLCGHEVHGSSCVLQVGDNNNVVSSSTGADCLTLGAGVTVQMGTHSITCTSSYCGTAINVTGSSGSGGKVDVYGSGGPAALITGCFKNGAVGAGTNAHMEDMLIDLTAQNGGSCSFPSLGTFATGYSGITGTSSNQFKDTTRLVIRNAQIGSSNGTASLVDSMIHGCNTAVALLPSASGLLLTDNSYDFVDSAASCTECTVRNVGVCHYYATLFGLGCATTLRPAWNGRTMVDDTVLNY